MRGDRETKTIFGTKKILFFVYFKASKSSLTKLCKLAFITFNFPFFFSPLGINLMQYKFENLESDPKRMWNRMMNNTSRKISLTFFLLLSHVRRSDMKNSLADFTGKLFCCTFCQFWLFKSWTFNDYVFCSCRFIVNLYHRKLNQLLFLRYSTVSVFHTYSFD